MRHITLRLTAALLAAALTVTGGSGPVGAEPVPPGTHQGSIAVGNFSGMRMENLTVRTDGGVELSRGDEYIGLGDIEVTSRRVGWSCTGIAVDSNDGYIIAWLDNRSGTELFDVIAQRFDSYGNRTGGEIILSTAPGERQRKGISCPEIAADSKGNFITVWTDEHEVYTAHQYEEIHAEWFDSGGNRLGDSAAVIRPLAADEAAVAVDSKGGFVIAWTDMRSGSTSRNIYAQRFGFNKTKIGSEVVIAATAREEVEPAVTVDSKDNIIIGWLDYTRSKNVYEYVNIHAQRFDPRWNRLGSEVVIPNATTIGQRRMPTLAVDSKDNLIIAWRNYNTTPESINGTFYIRRYDTGGNMTAGQTLVFRDGNEHPGNFAIAAIPEDRVMILLATAELNITGSNWTLTSYLYDYLLDSSFNWTGDRTLIDSGAEGYYVLAIDGHGRIITAHDYIDNRSYGKFFTRRYIHPFVSPGQLTVGPLSPPYLLRWSNLSAEIGLPNGTANAVSFGFSTDDGTTWTGLPANGSLAAAGTARSLLLRARLSTGDNTTSPVLRRITVNYIYNHPPTVTIGPDRWVLPNSTTSLFATASDDDGDSLKYKWSQAGGLPLALADTDTALVSFTPSTTGTYRLRVVVNDGFSDSAPAFVNVIVSSITPIPRLTISIPYEGQVFATGNITAVFVVENLTVAPGHGHVHYTVDGGPEQEWFTAAPFTLYTTEGNHTLRAYLVDSTHARLANPEAAAGVNFSVVPPAGPEWTESGITVSSDFPFWMLLLLLAATLGSGSVLLFWWSRGAPRRRINTQKHTSIPKKRQLY